MPRYCSEALFHITAPDKYEPFKGKAHGSAAFPGFPSASPASQAGYACGRHLFSFRYARFLYFSDHRGAVISYHINACDKHFPVLAGTYRCRREYGIGSAVMPFQNAGNNISTTSEVPLFRTRRRSAHLQGHRQTVRSRKLCLPNRFYTFRNSLFHGIIILLLYHCNKIRYQN